MGAPPGARANRWNQTVRAIERTGVIEDADAWLNLVWIAMWAGDEKVGNDALHVRLRLWLEANAPTAQTLPRALQEWVT